MGRINSLFGRVGKFYRNRLESPTIRSVFQKLAEMRDVIYQGNSAALEASASSGRESAGQGSPGCRSVAGSAPASAVSINSVTAQVIYPDSLGRRKALAKRV